MKKIIILGKSKKFIEIIRKLYTNYEINILSWIKLDKIIKSKSLKNTNTTKLT